MKIILVPLIDCRRTCSNQTHITFQHIKELWELIETPVANIVSNALLDRSIRQFLRSNDTRVPVELEHKTIFDTVLCHQFLLALLCIHIHTAELVHLKLLTIFSHTNLREEHRSRRLTLDRRCKEKIKNSCDQATCQTTRDIHCTLQECLHRSCTVDARRQHRINAKPLHKLNVVRKILRLRKS